MNWLKHNLTLIIIAIVAILGILIIGLCFYSDFIKEWAEVIASIIYIIGIGIGIVRLNIIENKIRGNNIVIKIADKFIEKKGEKEFEFKIVNVSKYDIFNVNVKFILGRDYYLKNTKITNTKIEHEIKTFFDRIPYKNKNDLRKLHAQRVLIKTKYDLIKEHFNVQDTDKQKDKFITIEIIFDYDGVKKAISQNYRNNDCVTNKEAIFDEGDSCSVINLENNFKKSVKSIDV